MQHNINMMIMTAAEELNWTGLDVDVDWLLIFIKRALNYSFCRIFLPMDERKLQLMLENEHNN
jgi:hypothetical protein